MMWHEESDFLDMFMAYFSQYEANFIERKRYRDFLLEVLCAHEWCQKMGVDPSDDGHNVANVEDELSESPTGTSCLSRALSNIECDLSAAQSREAGCSQEGFGNLLQSSGPEPVTHEIKLEAFDLNDVSEDLTSRNASMDDSTNHVLKPCAEDSFGYEEKNLNLDSCDSKPLSSTFQISTNVDNTCDAEGQTQPMSASSVDASVGKSKKNIFRCLTCYGNFSSKAHYSHHRCVDSIEPAQCECRLCRQIFTSELEMSQHRCIRAESVEEDWQCRICHKSFTAAYYLRRHQITHKEERPYKCDICGRAFKNASNMKQHKTFVHAGERPFKCKFCANKSYSRRSDMLKHERSHTGERPYQCSTCNKSFKDSSTMRQHERNHLK